MMFNKEGGSGRLQHSNVNGGFEQASVVLTGNADGIEDGVVVNANLCTLCKQNTLGLFAIQRWKYPTAREAMVLSIISIVITLLTSICGIVLGVVGGSATMLAFAFDGVMDIVTGLIVLWRFSSAAPGQHGRSRENRASVGIALSFFGLAVVVSLAAVGHLAMHERVGDQDWLLALTIPSFFMLLILGVLKLHVAIVLHSMALFEDGVSSLGGAALSLFVIIGVAAFRKNEALWWVDSACALIVSVLYVLFGLYILSKHPDWRNRAFWAGASETDEVRSEEDEDIGSALSQRFDIGIDLQPIDMDTI